MAQLQLNNMVSRMIAVGHFNLDCSMYLCIERSRSVHSLEVRLW